MKKSKGMSLDGRIKMFLSKLSFVPPERQEIILRKAILIIDNFLKSESKAYGLRIRLRRSLKKEQYLTAGQIEVVSKCIMLALALVWAGTKKPNPLKLKKI